MHRISDSLSLTRWKTARRIVLGTIIFAGSMATTAAAVQRMGARDTRVHTVNLSQEVYSGIGVTITARHGQVYVTEVNPDGPSLDVIYPGARLVSVDGERPASILEWKSNLRGEPGTPVELEVSYRCGGHQTVVLERDVIHVRP